MGKTGKAPERPTDFRMMPASIPLLRDAYSQIFYSSMSDQSNTRPAELYDVARPRFGTYKILLHLLFLLHNNPINP
jgi:hypothetical protein